jgi:hypothetical protein
MCIVSVTCGKKEDKHAERGGAGKGSKPHGGIILKAK